MVLRRDPVTGQKYWRCKDFPVCDYTEEISEDIDPDDGFEERDDELNARNQRSYF